MALKGIRVVHSSEWRVEWRGRPAGRADSETDRSTPLPRPHRVGDGTEYQGIIIAFGNIGAVQDLEILCLSLPSYEKKKNG